MTQRTYRRDIPCYIDGVSVASPARIIRIDAMRRRYSSRRDIPCHIDRLAVVSATRIIQIDAVNMKIVRRDIPCTSNT